MEAIRLEHEEQSPPRSRSPSNSETSQHTSLPKTTSRPNDQMSKILKLLEEGKNNSDKLNKRLDRLEGKLSRRENQGSEADADDNEVFENDLLRRLDGAQSDDNTSQDHHATSPKTTPTKVIRLQERQASKRSLKLACAERQAASLYTGIVTGNGETLTQYLRAKKFKSKRNGVEASIIARALDLTFDQYGEREARLIRCDATEVLIRRLVAILTADEDENWDFATQLEEIPRGGIPIPQKMVKDARRQAAYMSARTKRKVKDNTDTTSSDE
jgi:hypothetical protein